MVAHIIIHTCKMFLYAVLYALSCNHVLSFSFIKQTSTSFCINWQSWFICCGSVLLTDLSVLYLTWVLKRMKKVASATDPAFWSSIFVFGCLYSAVWPRLSFLYLSQQGYLIEMILQIQRRKNACQATERTLLKQRLTSCSETAIAPPFARSESGTCSFPILWQVIHVTLPPQYLPLHCSPSFLPQYP